MDNSVAMDPSVLTELTVRMTKKLNNGQVEAYVVSLRDNRILRGLIKDSKEKIEEGNWDMQRSHEGPGEVKLMEGFNDYVISVTDNYSGAWWPKVDQSESFVWYVYGYSSIKDAWGFDFEFDASGHFLAFDSGGTWYIHVPFDKVREL